MNSHGADILIFIIVIILWLKLLWTIHRAILTTNSTLRKPNKLINSPARVDLPNLRNSSFHVYIGTKIVCILCLLPLLVGAVVSVSVRKKHLLFNSIPLRLVGMRVSVIFRLRRKKILYLWALEESKLNLVLSWPRATKRN